MRWAILDTALVSVSVWHSTAGTAVSAVQHHGHHSSQVSTANCSPQLMVSLKVSLYVHYVFWYRNVFLIELFQKKYLSVCCRFENKTIYAMNSRETVPGQVYNVQVAHGPRSHGHKCGPALVPPPEPELREHAVISSFIISKYGVTVTQCTQGWMSGFYWIS